MVERASLYMHRGTSITRFEAEGGGYLHLLLQTVLIDTFGQFAEQWLRSSQVTARPLADAHFELCLPRVFHDTQRDAVNPAAILIRGVQ